MIFGATPKVVSLFKPVSVATNATQTGSIDTRGFKHARIVVHLDSQSSTTSAPAVLKLSEGDTTSSYADIVAFTGGTETSTSVGFVIPTAGTAPTFVVLDVDLKKRKRYLKITFTSGDGAQLASATAHLARPETHADAAAEVGAAAWVTG